jgi:hypothetical protein
MGILKNKFCENYFKVPNKIFDYELTPTAGWLYCYLISKPNNWKIFNADIKKKLFIRDNQTLAKYWNELLDKKLIARIKTKNENNQFSGGYDYEILNLPRIEECSELVEFSNSGKTPIRGNAQNNNKTNLINKTNISNNNININNKEKIKKEKSDVVAQKERFNFDFVGFTASEIETITDWLEYKTQAKKGYKTQIGLNKLRNQLLDFKNNNYDLSKIIDLSIANNWAGLFAPKQGKQTNSSNVIPNVERGSYSDDVAF